MIIHFKIVLVSPEPRIHRSPNVEFRVGQVVVHKSLKYRGVIIGWDETAKVSKHITGF